MHHTFTRTPLLALLCLAAATLSSGCIPLAIGAGATAGVAASQDRGFEQAVDDNEIGVEINRKLLAESQDLYARVSTQIRKGRVTLIGYVGRAEDRGRVERIVRSVGGVADVRNELQVGDPLSFSEKSSDALTATKLRSVLIGDNRVSSINYSIKVLRGNVYIGGTAMSQSELDSVIGDARGVSGVHNVVTNVDIKFAGPR